MFREALMTAAAVAMSGQAWCASDLVSRFSKDGEGWRELGDGVLTWVAEGGNPKGFLQGRDQQGGVTWFYVSPESWAGDWRDYTDLRYDLRLFSSGTMYADDDVVIVGANGTSLRWRAESPPGQEWTPFKVKLTAANFGVTEAEFRSVMRDVLELHIRGEFISGTDIEGLDNVVVMANPAPPQFSGRVTALPTYRLVCKNATTGQGVTRTGQTNPDWNCEDEGLVVNDGDQVSVTLSGKASK